MRAVAFYRYGPPDVLRLEEIERPAPEPHQVLVRVVAATATRTDCGLRGAEYFVGRLFTGLLRPKRPSIGLEFAGEVAEVGASVTEFQKGQRVFGICSGGNAEYVCVADSEPIAVVPERMSFVEAAGVADGALSAFSLLRSAGAEAGRLVAVYGASGSIGVGCVQVAKHLGAHVTAVCNTKNLELMRALGADEVVDYTEEDFTTRGPAYDVILDAAGKHTFLGCRATLKPDGVYVTTDPGFLWRDVVTTMFTRRGKLGIVRYTKPDLQSLTRLIDAGEYRAVIDRVYPIEDVVEAHRYVETHQKTGNVVLTVS
jgi:NADPH:quinone reductase-like Zn-dependent oxidoreductase